MKKKNHPNNPSEIEKMEKVRVGWVCGVKDTKWSQSTTYPSAVSQFKELRGMAACHCCSELKSRVYVADIVLHANSNPEEGQRPHAA